MSDEGHITVRNGILEHFQKNWMDGDMVIAYLILLHQCDWKTGIWIGSSARLNEAVPSWSAAKCKRVINRLVRGNYIDSEHIRGSRGNYTVKINNFEPLVGTLKGKRIRRTKGMDWREAVRVDESKIMDEPLVDESKLTGEPLSRLKASRLFPRLSLNTACDRETNKKSNK